MNRHQWLGALLTLMVSASAGAQRTLFPRELASRSVSIERWAQSAPARGLLVNPLRMDAAHERELLHPMLSAMDRAPEPRWVIARF